MRNFFYLFFIIFMATGCSSLYQKYYDRQLSSANNVTKSCENGYADARLRSSAGSHYCLNLKNVSNYRPFGDLDCSKGFVSALALTESRYCTRLVKINRYVTYYSDQECPEGFVESMSRHGNKMCLRLSKAYKYVPFDNQPCEESFSSVTALAGNTFCQLD